MVNRRKQAVERMEMDHLKALLISLTDSSTATDSEDKSKNKHPRQIALETAKSRYSGSAPKSELGLGSTIAIAQNFKIRDWNLLQKHWNSISDELKTRVRNIPFDVSSWLKYIHHIGVEHTFLLACAAAGMFIFYCSDVREKVRRY